MQFVQRLVELTTIPDPFGSSSSEDDDDDDDDEDENDEDDKEEEEEDSGDDSDDDDNKKAQGVSSSPPTKLPIGGESGPSPPTPLLLLEEEPVFSPAPPPLTMMQLLHQKSDDDVLAEDRLELLSSTEQQQPTHQHHCTPPQRRRDTPQHAQEQQASPPTQPTRTSNSSSSSGSSGGSGGSVGSSSRRTSRGDGGDRDSRSERWRLVLKEECVDVDALRGLCWSGTPPEMRALVWRLCIGYMPPVVSRRKATLDRMRQEYLFTSNDLCTAAQAWREEVEDGTSVRRLSSSSSSSSSLPAAAAAAAAATMATTPESSLTYEQKQWRQIYIDVPRVAFGTPLLRTRQVQNLLQRMLYTWAITHPASGYVQGLNDLACPFVCVFMEEQFGPRVLATTLAQLGGGGGDGGDDDKSNNSKNSLQDDRVATTARATQQQQLVDAISDLIASSHSNSDEILAQIEADVFHCLSRILDQVHDNYCSGQPGIQKRMFELKQIVSRVEPRLMAKLDECGVDVTPFGVRWINCLLLREFPTDCIFRLLDTYIAEGDGFGSFYIYVCAALLLRFAGEIIAGSEEDVLMLVAKLPTDSWKEEDEMMLLLGHAHQLRSLYPRGCAHLE